MKESGLSRSLPAASLTFVLLASATGLLCTRIGDYDDAILLMGARLVRAGLIPYRDFYAHYGPLGFSLQGLLSGLLHNPPLALRIGQAFFLATVGAAGYLVAHLRGGRAAAWASVAFVLVLSPAALLASFYGLALTLAALGAFALASGTTGLPTGDRWAAGAGILLAAAALTRPVFAAYAALAMAGVGIATGPGPDRRRHLPLAALACAAGIAAAWLLFYRAIAPAQALEATVLLPRRLIEGGRRYREAEFLRAPLPLAFGFAALHAAIPLLWTTALPSRRSRALGAAGILLSGALPLWLRVSSRPERDGVFVAAGAVLIAIVMIARARRALVEDATLRAAALFGLAAAAFEHYLWARADRPHFLLFLSAGAAGAALTAVRLRGPGRAALAALFLFVYAVFLRSPDRVLAPVESLGNGGLSAAARRRRAPHSSWKSIWPCGEIPADAAAAVAYADRQADSASRFVAVGSDQAIVDQDPVLLFLLSARPPYTRWYQYDPGIQDSPPVQRQMVEELEHSGSRTAVVWFTAFYAPGANAPRTPFDEAFDRLYPVHGPRFGSYEIRLRADSAASVP